MPGDYFLDAGEPAPAAMANIPRENFMRISIGRGNGIHSSFSQCGVSSFLGSGEFASRSHCSAEVDIFTDDTRFQGPSPALFHNFFHSCGKLRGLTLRPVRGTDCTIAFGPRTIRTTRGPRN